MDDEADEPARADDARERNAGGETAAASPRSDATRRSRDHREVFSIVVPAVIVSMFGIDSKAFFITMPFCSAIAAAIGYAFCLLTLLARRHAKSAERAYLAVFAGVVVSLLAIFPFIDDFFTPNAIVVPDFDSIWRFQALVICALIVIPVQTSLWFMAGETNEPPRDADAAATP